MLTDTHSHIHDRETYNWALKNHKKENPEDWTPDKLLSRAKANGIHRIICVGTTEKDSLEAADFAKRYTSEDLRLYSSYGIHPDSAEGFDIGIFSEHKTKNPLFRGLHKTVPSTRRDAAQACLEAQDAKRRIFRRSENIPISNPIIAIGEVGLDYHNGSGNRNAQIKLFEQMLALAKDLDLPLIFHVRDAFSDFFSIVDNFHIKRAVVHSFSDTKPTLEQCLDHDFYIGVNGLATFAKDLPLPPLERILLETDAPFLTPTPFRGKINESANISLIAQYLSDKLGVSYVQISKETEKNAEELFHFDARS
jgi:TatD DNase family protein